MLPEILEAETEAKIPSFVYLLEIITSCRSTPENRADSLLRLEEEFSKVVLRPNVSRAAKSAWWDAQSKPHSCIAMPLVALLHRLHTQCSASENFKYGPAQIDLVSKQYSSCFTILQGLCLKDRQSQQICATRSTLELILDIINAKYWTQLEDIASIPAYAIDLLICITVSSSTASHLVESLQGEEIIRALMERQTLGESSSSSQGRRAVTLDQVEDNPIAVKCAEFLLFYEYEREGQGVNRLRIDDLIGNDSSLISDTFRKAVKKTHRGKASVMEAKEKENGGSRRARTTSPKKDEKNKSIKSEPLQIKFSSSGRQFQHTPVNLSATKLNSLINAQGEKGVKAGSSPFEPKAVIIDKAHERGRSRNRSPLIETQPSASSTSTTILPPSSSQHQITASVSSMHSSPLKTLIGPSPAVQRAQARSVSPIKRKPNPHNLQASTPLPAL